MEDPEIWYADEWQNVVKRVTPAYRKQHIAHAPDRFFSSESEAMNWKRARLLKRIECSEQVLESAKRTLKNFDKKFGLTEN